MRTLVMAHVTEVYGPVQALCNYCKKRDALTTILHPLPNSSISVSKYETYARGVCTRRATIRRRAYPQPLGLAVDFFINMFLALSSRQRYDRIVGIDNLNAMSGILLRRFGFAKNVIFYTIDFAPRRFSNRCLNFLYHATDSFCVKRADSTWSVSERICRVRSSQGLDDRRNILVPIGVEEIPGTRLNRDSFILVIASYLTESKGVELAISSMRELRNSLPRVRLEIIGIGPYEHALMKLVRDLGLEDCVSFLGVMEHDKLMVHLQTRGVGIATYRQDTNSISYFADPTKPKEYLACGLPVIITWVPWIAREVDERPMGVAIHYDKSEFISAVTKLLTDGNFYDRCQENAIKFTASADWTAIYNRAFRASTLLV